MRPLYLKTPFFNDLKNHKTKYLLRLEVDLVQCEGKHILLSSAGQSKPAFVRRVRIVPASRLPFSILNSIGFKTRQQVVGFLESVYKVKNIDRIVVLEVIVQ